MIAEERASFYERGIVSLKRFASKKSVDFAKRTIDDELARLKIKSGGKIHAGKLKDLPVFQQTGRLSTMIKPGATLEPLFTSELLETMNDLAGKRLRPAHPHPQLLLSLPHREEWSLENLNWHLDLAVPEKNEIPGIQAFILIDDILPRGGATLAIAGSHKLHYLKKNETAHAFLRNRSISFEPTSIEGIDVSIVEMSGKAGDVFLMDLRVLHSPSINATKNIRMMTTNRFI